MRIQHNITAMNSYRNFANNNAQLGKNLEKLSSGYKINRAGDDAAGLAISQKMRAQIQGLEGAQKNAKDGISLVQTAEGALQEVHDMLNRMYSLAEQSANGTYDKTLDRVQLQKEVDSLRDEINRIADSANYNGMNLLDGSLQRNSKVWKISVSGTAASGNAIAGFDVSGTCAEKMTTGKINITGIANAKIQADGTWSVKSATDKIHDGAQVKITYGGVTFYAYVTTDLKAGDTITGYADGETALGYEANKAKEGNGKGGYHIRVTLGANLTVTGTKQVSGTTGDSGVSVKAARQEDGRNLSLQIGDTGDDFNQLTVAVKNVHTQAMGVSGVDISTQAGAKNALNKIKASVNYVSDIRGNLGALQNRLDHTINNLSVMTENITNAESTIRDTDMADEMMKYTKNNILNQSAQAMLAQANQLPQGILQLLQ